jgi:hypothetical protein
MRLSPTAPLSLALTAALLLLTACNRPLDAAALNAIIAKDLRVPPRITLFMPFGISPRTDPGQHCDDPVFEPFGVAEVRSRSLEDAGLVTLKELHPCGDVDIEFTPLAAHDVLPSVAPAGDTDHYAFLSLATYKGYDILHLTQTPTSANADLAVRYTLTASGKAYADAGGQTEEKKCAIASDEIVCTSTYKLIRTGHTWHPDSPNLLQ